MKLNLIDYEIAKKLHGLDIPFTALLAAAIMKADTNNLKKLKEKFPETLEDITVRRWARHERPDDDVSISRAREVANAYMEGKMI